MNRLAVIALSATACAGLIVMADQAGVVPASWIHGGEIHSRFLTGALIVTGCVMSLVRNGRIAVFSTIDALCIVATFFGAIFYSPHSSYSPSKGALTAFFFYFAVRLLMRHTDTDAFRFGFITVAMFGALGLLGYAIGDSRLYYEGAQSTGMAPITALAFVVMGVTGYLNDA